MKLGTINGYQPSPMRYKHKRCTFDGTLRGLTLTALSLGAKPGEIIYGDYGAGMQKYRLIFAPYDPRCGGYWVEKWRGE
jgi:hypothetical protein